MLAIEQVEVIPIRVPRKEPVLSAANAGAPITASEFGIVRIVTRDGVEGLGEISITFPRIAHSLCHAARRLIVPLLIGRNGLERPGILADIDHALAGEMSAAYLRAAFEMALLDLAGRYYSVPAFELLGGRLRDRIPLAWGIYQGPPAEMAAHAACAKKEGYHAIKLKIGRRLADDLAAVEAVTRAVGPEVPLRLDANGGWTSVAEAAHNIRALSDVASIAWIEQPLPRRNLDGLRELRRMTGVPIMADESCQTLRDAHELARAQAADVFNIYIVEAGGPQAAAHMFALAAALNVPAIIGSQAELGIGTAACAHLGVAVPNLPYACECFGPLRYEQDIVANTISIAGGFLAPPEGPGLGVSLNWDIVRQYACEI